MIRLSQDMVRMDHAWVPQGPWGGSDDGRRWQARTCGAARVSGAALAALPQAASGIAVDCSALTKSYDGVPVLRDISVTFMQGTVNVLAGENGAGKSTRS